MVIYLDESGDLGFDFSKKGTTRYFIITILLCRTKESDKSIQQSVKRSLRNKIGKNVEELKGVNTAHPVKRYFLKHIKEQEWNIYTVILDKRQVNPDLQSKQGKKRLYNYLSRVLIEQIEFPDNIPTLTLVVDKMKNKKDIEEFNQYLENHLTAHLPLNCIFYPYHKDSKEHPGLQAVDMFCWGIFRKYMAMDEAWYSCYQDKIKYEKVYLQ